MKVLLIGVDEAGRGAWAGPLVAAAACLKTGKKFNHPLIRDSKKLSPRQREEVFNYLQDVVEIGIGIVTAKEIDEMGLQWANVVAVERAISHVVVRQAHHDIRYVVDYIGGFKNYTTLEDNYSLHKFGESKFTEIAAASIVAKVTRDKMLIKLAKKFPDYGFELHKGYGTALHQERLKRHGVTEVHRMSFGPIGKVKIKKSKLETKKF